MTRSHTTENGETHRGCFTKDCPTCNPGLVGVVRFVLRVVLIITFLVVWEQYTLLKDQLRSCYTMEYKTVEDCASDYNWDFIK